MTGVLLLGHGSCQIEAKKAFNLVSDGVSAIVKYPVRQAVLNNGEPTLDQAVASLLNFGARRIRVVPLFLFEGTHVKIDIPERLRNLKLKHLDIEFELTDCFGPDSRVIDLIISRIKQFTDDNSDFESMLSNPELIEQQSFDRIERALALVRLSDSHSFIVQRVVHAVGDLGIAGEVYAPNEAVEAGTTALLSGKNVVTDVEMVRAGIRGSSLASFGGQVFCLIKDSKVAENAQKLGITRAASAIKAVAGMTQGGIIAIGNAPTALFEVCRLINDGKIKPALVVGAPVGFVGCSESKQALMKSGVSCIVIKGTRGGSAVAAAIVNTLIELARRSER